MADRTTDDERREVSDLVEQLYRESGEPTYAAFARRAGVSGGLLIDWRMRRTTPSAINLIRMLRAAGRLEEEPASTAAAPQSDAPDRLHPELEAALERLAMEVKDGFGRLDRRMGRLETRLPDAIRRAPTRRAQGQ